MNIQKIYTHPSASHLQSSSVSHRFSLNLNIAAVVIAKLKFER